MMWWMWVISCSDYWHFCYMAGDDEDHIHRWYSSKFERHWCQPRLVDCAHTPWLRLFTTEKYQVRLFDWVILYADCSELVASNFVGTRGRAHREIFYADCDDFPLPFVPICHFEKVFDKIAQSDLLTIKFKSDKHTWKSPWKQALEANYSRFNRQMLDISNFQCQLQLSAKIRAQHHPH